MVLETTEQAQTALQPVRLRILQLAHEPASATSLAPKLELPRQVVNYHLRELEAAGLVVLVEERPRRGRIERLYRSVAESFVVAPSVMAEVGADPDSVPDRGSSDYLVALGARLIDDMASLRSSGHFPTLAIETEIAFESNAARATFAQDLALAVRRLAAEYHRPSSTAQPFRLVVATHPMPSPPKTEEAS